MPFECALEMFCDYLGAGRAYSENNFTYRGEYEWWLKKKKNPLAMHPAIQYFITDMLSYCSCHNKLPSRKTALAKYNFAKELYK